MVFRPLAGCGLFPSGRCLRHGLSGVSVPLRGVGCFQVQTDLYMPRLVSVPLRGVGCFLITPARSSRATGFRPLAGCGLFQNHVGRAGGPPEFPSPCGVWVVSGPIVAKMASWKSFRPLAGCGLFLESNGEFDAYERFPSPCGVWVVSLAKVNTYGLTIKFPSPCGVWVVSSG